MTEWLTCKQIAQRFGYSPRTVMKWAIKKKFKTQQGGIGVKVLIDLQDFKRYSFSIKPYRKSL
ncbi:MAG: helix-turn-helix domain-containing protein [Ignavibacteriales bacterium]